VWQEEKKNQTQHLKKTTFEEREQTYTLLGFKLEVQRHPQQRQTEGGKVPGGEGVTLVRKERE